MASRFTLKKKPGVKDRDQGASVRLLGRGVGFAITWLLPSLGDCSIAPASGFRVLEAREVLALKAKREKEASVVRQNAPKADSLIHPGQSNCKAVLDPRQGSRPGGDCRLLLGRKGCPCAGGEDDATEAGGRGKPRPSGLGVIQEEEAGCCGLSSGFRRAPHARTEE